MWKHISRASLQCILQSQLLQITSKHVYPISGTYKHVNMLTRVSSNMVLITTGSINNELGPSIRFYIGVAAAGRLGSRSWHSAGRSHWVHSSVGQGLTRPTSTSLYLSHPCDASKKGGERSGLSWPRSGLVFDLWWTVSSGNPRNPVESGRITFRTRLPSW